MERSGIFGVPQERIKLVKLSNRWLDTAIAVRRHIRLLWRIGSSNEKKSLFHRLKEVFLSLSIAMKSGFTERKI